MNIDLIKLKNNLIEYISIDEIYKIDESYYNKTNIISLDKIHISGEIYKSDEDYELDIDVSGKMILPCSICLKPIEYNFNININENLFESLDEIIKNNKKNDNTIDILPILWENILVEIPIRVVHPDCNGIKSGDGWKFITGYEDKTNPKLEKIKDILE